MIVLVPNPDPVDDGHGDFSFGYDGDAEYLASIANPALARDVQQIVDAYRAAGYTVAPQHAFYAWDCYSDSLSASWLLVGGDIVAVTIRFLIPEPGI